MTIMRFSINRTSSGGSLAATVDPKANGTFKEGQHWFIELFSLEELINFIKSTASEDRSEIVIGMNRYDLKGPYIEIYDDWRE